MHMPLKGKVPRTSVNRTQDAARYAQEFDEAVVDICASAFQGFETGVGLPALDVLAAEAALEEMPTQLGDWGTEEGARGGHIEEMGTARGGKHWESGTSVVNVHRADLRKEGYRDLDHWLENPAHVYIGRNVKKGAKDSKWGNPYTIKEHGLEGCLALYTQRIVTGVDEKGIRNSLRNDLSEL